MKINLPYLIAFLALLIIEIIIALFVRDAIIRPYVGDVLVIILLYTFIRGIFQKPLKYLPVFLFIFALAVEIAQYYQIARLLNLQSNKIVSTIIGSTYDIKDIVCYLLGTVILIIWERLEKAKVPG
ncbi:DUF2809 domain-containing protein [Acetivibrio straminisolvens]|jgi:hypothetical protein|uniref:DUF2809 domain-containing protein n=1 Tax=Acetivibrio straminisolvens JCM 21531 TaxID=1294263 RepID=W4VB68_9FIRM|nr:DUF2809 domain-containing protein [Acetivibrio straminisolvens]GAE89989.1 hypothetical protein JCM21531_3565 [Acetivibrio straminisolvens JCM 21531]